MPISPNFNSIFSSDFEINFTQCMPNGFLKLPELCNIFQLTAAGHSKMGGISFTDMQEFNQAWVLSRMRVEISELPKWRDIVTVKTWINTLENSRSVRAMEMYCNGKKIIGSETFWVVFNTEIRRPEALALPFEHFELYPEKKATLQPFSRINLNHDKKLVHEKSIFLSDLDNVNHVNHVKYLEWCLDFVDKKLILNQNIESFEMNFLKELSYHDSVQIHKNIGVDYLIFTVTKEENSCFALQLNIK
ncbi:MAG: acyl-[acyl-carrier-protein] thioesterase [Flavobacterium sp.]|nr:acyl-[acyl-carrier-protein] thioesterase [Flavobacterium sp.]